GAFCIHSYSGLLSDIGFAKQLAKGGWIVPIAAFKRDKAFEDQRTSAVMLFEVFDLAKHIFAQCVDGTLHPLILGRIDGWPARSAGALFGLGAPSGLLVVEIGDLIDPTIECVAALQIANLDRMVFLIGPMEGAANLNHRRLARLGDIAAPQIQ